MKTQKFSKGFTLVETLVAIGILSLSITATFTAVQNGIQSSTTAKDQTIAFYLAQEGMEFIKNIRDENALNSLDGSPTHWLYGMSSAPSDPCYFGEFCVIDSPQKTITQCSGGLGTCPVLRQEASSGLFGYNSGWPATTFKREIQFQQISANEVTVLMNISWTYRGQSKSFQVSELFFNRQ